MTGSAPAPARRRTWSLWLRGLGDDGASPLRTAGIAVWRRRGSLLATARGAILMAGGATLGAHLWWMWSRGFHSQDGPAHLYAATALGHLLDGREGLLAQVYEMNVASDPNWITYPILTALLQVVAPRTAELLVVSLLASGLAAGLWYAVTARGRGTAPVAVAGLPIAVGWSLHTGLYNFTASIALMLAIIGYLLRVADRLDARRASLVAALLVLLYFSHPLSVAVVYAVIGVTGAAIALATPRGRGRWRVLAARGATLAGMVTPSALLMLDFLADSETVRPREVPRDAWDAVIDTALFRWPIGAVSTHDVGWATVVAAATWITVAVLVARRCLRRDWSRWDVLLALPVITGAGAVVLPDRLVGGTLVQPRLAIYACLMLLLWVAVANAGTRALPWLSIGLAVVGTVAMAGLLHTRAEPYRQIAVAADEVLATAPSIAPESLVLSAVSSRAPTLASAVPLVHIVDRVLLQAGAVPVSTLDAGSGYGPIRYRPRFDPRPALRGFPRNRIHGEELSPEVFANIAARYEGATGRGVDYVVLVGYDLEPAEVGEFRTFGFDVVRHTLPEGLVWLFRAPTSRPTGVARSP